MGLSGSVIMTVVVVALVLLLLLGILKFCKEASWYQHDFPHPGELEGTYMDAYGFIPKDIGIATFV